MACHLHFFLYEKVQLNALLQSLQSDNLNLTIKKYCQFSKE